VIFYCYLEQAVDMNRCRLFVGNVGMQFSEQDLARYMLWYGTVVQCIIIRDVRGVSRRFGFVEFSNPRECKRVLDRSSHFIRGCRIFPQVAIPKGGFSNRVVGSLRCSSCVRGDNRQVNREENFRRLPYFRE
jgi:RNA recognition motif-containing protein